MITVQESVGFDVKLLQIPVCLMLQNKAADFPKHPAL